MKLINLIVILFLIFNTNANAQDLSEVRQGFELLKKCYVGYYEDVDSLNNAKQKSDNLLRKNKADLRNRHLVIYHLVMHMEYALKQSNATNACNSLSLAVSEFEKIKDLEATNRIARYGTYQTRFQINQKELEKFYESTYCIENSIKLNSDCAGSKIYKTENNKNSNVEDKIENKVNKDVQKSMPLQSSNPTLVLKKLKDSINLGLLNNEFFEIVKLIKGDGRLIPGVEGVPYEIKIKNTFSKKTIFFEKGKYTIEDRRNESGENKSWEAYFEGIANFQKIVYALNYYGSENYSIYVQGSADKLLMRATPLDKLYASSEFQEIRLIEVKDNSINEKTIIINNEYNNETLPDLRAAFIKFSILSNEEFKKDKIHIVKGFVKKNEGAEFRNCSIIIYINWEKSINYETEQHFKQ